MSSRYIHAVVSSPINLLTIISLDESVIKSLSVGVYILIICHSKHLRHFLAVFFFFYSCVALKDSPFVQNLN